MADAYWNQQAPITNPLPSSAGLLKRPRTSDYDFPQSGTLSTHELQKFLARGNDRYGSGGVKDTKSIGSAYDRYLQNMQFTSTSSLEANSLGKSGGGMPNFSSDSIAMSHSESIDGRGLIGRCPADALNGRDMGFDRRISTDAPNGRGMDFDDRLPPVDPMLRQGRETLPLPLDASDTLYVEGIPSDCREREVAHIFRPFVGYREVRLVKKESRHRDSRHRDETVVFCFVDFISKACAATAMSALQGYKIDENDSDSPYLRIQFSKSPGPKSSSRGRR